jgi:DNA-directed RNA polymerase subunit beta
VRPSRSGGRPSARTSLQAVFSEVFPIESYDEKIKLEFGDYEIGEPKLSPLECQRESQTFAAPLYVTFRLREDKNVKEERVYMGELPLMAPQGTFIINGAERVVGQPAAPLARHLFRVEPARQRQGALLLPHHSRPRFVARSHVRHERLALRPSRSPQAPPEVPRTTFLRALGYSTDEEIIKLFYTIATSS